MPKIDTSKTTWDFSPLLSGDDDPKIKEYRQQMTDFADKFAAKWRERTDYLEDPKVLKEALDELEAFERHKATATEAQYFGLRLTLDSSNPVLQAKDNQANEFLRQLVTKVQFFEINISKIDPAKHTLFLKAPGLTDYRHYLAKHFARAKYVLSEPEERIMILKSAAAHDKWIEMTQRFLAEGEREVKDEEGNTIKATYEKLLSLLSSRQKPVRDAAAGQLNDLLEDYLDMAESEMNAILADKKVNDELRGYERPDKARHIADDVETEVVDALVEAVTDRADISQRFYGLKAKLLGQEKLGYHERNVPYGTTEKPYSFGDAADLVFEVFSSVDPEFGDIFKRFVEAGQVDVYPKKGKRGGAFCTISSLAHPIYVMLNHTDQLKDVSTIAHEFGHAINHELAKCENGLNYGISLATAEVASTFMEGFVLDRLLEEADDELRLELMVGQLDGAISSITRQIHMYRFEQELHDEFRKAGFLSRGDIGRLFRKHMEAYMGPAVSQDSGSENWWLYVGHFRVMFYVYAYASGELISNALRARVKANPEFVKEVRDKFLTVGVSKSMKEMFAEMDIDVTDKAFWEEGLTEIEKLLDETEALAKKLGKV